jgi:transcriptional regulator
MFRPRAFAVDDPASLHRVIRDRVFATLALVHDGDIYFAYAPVVLDADAGLGRIRFHLAKANPVASLADGVKLSVSFAGPDAYISPDWYETEGLVPTWNYVAVEGRGVAHKLDRQGLVDLLEDLSAQEEAHLLPKRPWTLGKLPATRIDALLGAIEGFVLSFETLEGKFKLSQDKKPADVAGALGGLEARGDARNLAVAAAMRNETRGER